MSLSRHAIRAIKQNPGPSHLGVLGITVALSAPQVRGGDAHAAIFRNCRAFMTSISNRRRLARRALALLATTGACIGLGCLLGARPVGRAAGLPEQGSARWLLRLFGVRELLLSLGLYRSLRRDDPQQARLL